MISTYVLERRLGNWANAGDPLESWQWLCGHELDKYYYLRTAKKIRLHASKHWLPESHRVLVTPSGNVKIDGNFIWLASGIQELLRPFANTYMYVQVELL